MLKRTITYPNIDDEMVTEEFYFGITKAELAEMEMEKPGGFKNYVEALIAANDGKTILTLIKDFIRMTVGHRVNGRFVKDEEFTAAFMSSEPYSAIFMEFLQNPNSVEDFIKGVLPADLADKFVEEAASAKSPNHEYTEKELLEMSWEEFDRVAGTDAKEMTKEHLQIAFLRKERNPRPAKKKAKKALPQPV